ncbi:MAG: hypothetical protein N2Z58_07160 [Fervidobacterium sp.]|nr:hypothetical protein [Fervidobacterium sp.]
MMCFGDLVEYSKVFGTTLLDEYILKFFKNVVALRKSSDFSGYWIVSFFNEVLVEDFVFDGIEKAKEAFHFLPYVFEMEEVLIFSKEPLPEELKSIYADSEKFRKLTDIEQRLTKFSYQISGIGSILSSLTEPLPTELLLPLFAETISELFVTSVGVYRRLKERSHLIYFVGNFKFEKEIETPKFNGLIFGKTSEGFGFEFEGSEGEKFYVLLERKDLEIEEQSILSAIGLVFQKGRDLMKSAEIFGKNEKLVQQYEFILRSLSEFSVYVLSSKNFDELKKNIVDYIAEVYQAKHVLLYEGKENLRLTFYKTFEKRAFPNLITYDEIKEELSKALDFYSFELMDENVFIIVGEEVLPGYLSEQVKELIKQTISTEILRAIQNVFYHEQLIKEKNVVEFYNTVISFIVENYLAFQEMAPEDILDVFETYSKSFFPFVIKGISLYDKYVYGQIDSLNELMIKNVASVYGKVYYELKRPLTLEDEKLLVLSSIVLFSSIEYSILLNKNSFSKEDILRFGEFRSLRKSKDELAIIEGKDDLATVTIDFGDRCYSILPKIFLE